MQVVARRPGCPPARDGPATADELQAGFEALFIASDFGHAEALRIPSEDVADEGRAKQTGVAALFLAAESGHAEAPRLLSPSRDDALVSCVE